MKQLTIRPYWLDRCRCINLSSHTCCALLCCSSGVSISDQLLFVEEIGLHVVIEDGTCNATDQHNTNQHHLTSEHKLGLFLQDGIGGRREWLGRSYGSLFTLLDGPGVNLGHTLVPRCHGCQVYQFPGGRGQTARLRCSGLGGRHRLRCCSCWSHSGKLLVPILGVRLGSHRRGREGCDAARLFLASLASERCLSPCLARPLRGEVNTGQRCLEGAFWLLPHFLLLRVRRPKQLRHFCCHGNLLLAPREVN